MTLQVFDGMAIDTPETDPVTDDNVMSSWNGCRVVYRRIPRFSPFWIVVVRSVRPTFVSTIAWSSDLVTGHLEGQSQTLVQVNVDVLVYAVQTYTSLFEVSIQMSPRPDGASAAVFVAGAPALARTWIALDVPVPASVAVSTLTQAIERFIVPLRRPINCSRNVQNLRTGWILMFVPTAGM
jgi:hypothetical protein